MSYAFNRHPLRALPVVSLVWLCACGDEGKKSANLDGDGRDASATETSSPPDGAASEVTDDSGPRLDAALVDAAGAALDAGFVPGSLLGDADIPPVIVPPLPVGTPLCSELETWTGPESSEAFPPAAVQLLAVAGESGTRVFLREPLVVMEDAGPTVVADSGSEPSAPDAGDAGDSGPDASVAPLDAGSPFDPREGDPGDAGPDVSALPSAWLLVVDGDSVVTVGLPSMFDVEAGVAIDPEGLQLVLVTRGRAGFALSSRTSVGAEFDEPAVDAFARINALGAQGGARFAAPVWSASGERLYVSEGASSFNPLQLHRQDGYWAVEMRLEYSGLQDTVITSAAADDLTVFTFSAEDGSAAAHWRDHPNLPFRESQPLSFEQPVHVDAECTSLRYAEPCDGPSDCSRIVMRSSE